MLFISSFIAYVLLVPSQASYNCGLSQCFIDCSESEIDCNGIIDASNSSSLTLLCNEQGSCKGTIIYTPNNTLSSTNITCNALNSCSNTTIYYLSDATAYPLNHNINIHCISIDDSCNNIELNANYAGNVYFGCYGIQCNEVRLKVDHVTNVNISCIGHKETANHDDTTDGCNDISCIGHTETANHDDTAYGCKSLYILSRYIKSINIKCSGYRGCYDPTIYASEANELTLISRDNGMYSGNIYGYDITNKFDVTCIGGYDEIVENYNACNNVKFYIPDGSNIYQWVNPFKLSCYGYGCGKLKLSNPNGGIQGLSSTNLALNGCGQYLLDECIETWVLTCGGSSKTAYFKGDDCSYNDQRGTFDGCGCNGFITDIKSVFIDDKSSSLCIYDYFGTPGGDIITTNTPTNGNNNLKVIGSVIIGIICQFLVF